MSGIFGARRMYLDYASAPPVVPEAIAAMRKAERLVGNPGAIHAEGVAAKKSLEDSRVRIAAQIGCKERQIIFTSGLTEANNLAIVGCAKHLEISRTVLDTSQGQSLAGTHWIVSSIEHDSVLVNFSEVERMGGTVTHIDPDKTGVVTGESVVRALRPETVFVSIGWANNEIGTIQPISKIAERIREHEKRHGTSIVFHSDAGQAPLYLPTVVSSLGVDLLSLGGNKLCGPHGIGALYVGKRVSLAPVSFGGKQERGLRAGTENVALAAGFAASYEKVSGERAREGKRVTLLRDTLAHLLGKHLPGMVINGDLKHALPHMLNVSIPNISSEYVTLALDAKGIAVSTKSACREGEESMSHVVFALGDAKHAESSVALAKEERAKNTIRFSLGRATSARDIRKVVETLTHVLQNLTKNGDEHNSFVTKNGDGRNSFVRRMF